MSPVQLFRSFHLVLSHQIEKELEEKQERLSQHCASAEQLLQLQQTYEFTANVARQEEKVRRKEQEILETREKQQREALEQAVARLERRHSALRRSLCLEPEADEARRRSIVASLGYNGLRSTAVPELDQERFGNCTNITTISRLPVQSAQGCIG